MFAHCHMCDKERQVHYRDNGILIGWPQFNCQSEALSSASWRLITDEIGLTCPTIQRNGNCILESLNKNVLWFDAHWYHCTVRCRTYFLNSHFPFPSFISTRYKFIFWHSLSLFHKSWSSLLMSSSGSTRGVKFRISVSSIASRLYMNYPEEMPSI